MRIYIKTDDVNKLSAKTKQDIKVVPTRVKLGIPLVQDGYEIYDDERFNDIDVTELQKKVNVVTEEPIKDQEKL